MANTFINPQKDFSNLEGFGIGSGLKAKKTTTTKTNPKAEMPLGMVIGPADYFDDDEVYETNPLQTWGWETAPAYEPLKDEDRYADDGDYNTDTSSIEIKVHDGNTVNIDLVPLKEEIKEENKLTWGEF